MASATAGLTLTIAGQSYVLERTGDGWRLTTARGLVYTVVRNVTRPTCNCPWARHRGDGSCKHTEALVGVGLLEAH